VQKFIYFSNSEFNSEIKCETNIYTHYMHRDISSLYLIFDDYGVHL